MSKAIAILLKDKWLRAQEIAGDERKDDKKVVEIYKKIGGPFREGSQEEIEGIAKYHMVILEKEKIVETKKVEKKVEEKVEPKKIEKPKKK